VAVCRARYRIGRGSPMRAAVEKWFVLLGLIAAVNTPAVANDSFVNCRASDPMICTVGSQPSAQAQFRERCAQSPEQCSFRADGSIASWTEKSAMPDSLRAELQRRAAAARAKTTHGESK
jgi:hypothetical protein